MRVLALTILGALLVAGCAKDDRAPYELYPDDEDPTVPPRSTGGNTIYLEERDRAGSGAPERRVGDWWVFRETGFDIGEGRGERWEINGEQTVQRGGRLYDVYVMDTFQRTGTEPWDALATYWLRTGDLALLRETTYFNRTTEAGRLVGAMHATYNTPCEWIRWSFFVGDRILTCKSTIGFEYNQNGTAPGDDRTETIQTHVHGREVLTVPAGKFRTDKVDMVRSWDQKTQSSTEWWSKDACAPARFHRGTGDAKVSFDLAAFQCSDARR